MAKGVRVKLENVRISFPSLFTPRKANDDAEPKYSAVFIFEKESKNTKKMEAAIEEALQEGKEIWGGKIPPRGQLKLCLRDGDSDREGEEYQGMNFVSSSSKSKPQVVDRMREPITEASDVYPGCYVNATLTVKAWKHPAGGKGVTAYLGNIQKVRDGEPLGGVGPSAQEEFSVLEDDDDFLS